MYIRRPDAVTYCSQLGKLFETEFIDLVKYHSSEHNGISLKFDTDADAKEGTDFMVNGLRYDITADICSKDHTVILDREFLIDGNSVVIRFGIRTGNNTVQFEQPVIVLGLECEKFYFKNWACRIAESLVNSLNEITEIAEDLFWTWTDSQIAV